MKRVFYIILFVFVALIGIMSIIPLFFKNSISEEIKIAINNQIKGDVDFSEFHISLFNKFPKVEMQIIGLSIVGTGDFHNDTLIAINELSGAITLAELFKKKELQITSLNINGASILLKTIEGGAANWDIIPTKEFSQTEEKPAEKQDENIKILLDNLEINGLNLEYLDEPLVMLFQLNNLSAKSKGEVAGSEMNFNIETQVEELIFEYDSVRYLSNTSLRVVSQMLFDSEEMSFSFSESNVWLNNLLLKLEGSFAMPSDSIYFDLGLSNNSKDFKDILALVPAGYQSYLEKINAEGTASVAGNFKGWYYGEDYPSLNFNIEIAEGTFKYADLPEQIENIALNATLSKPQGPLDSLVLDVQKASASLKGTPVSAQLKITTPFSDPLYAGQLSGEIDFRDLNKAIPMEGVNLQGKLSTNILLEGRQSDINNSAFNKFKSNGSVSLQNFSYHSEDLKQSVNIHSGKLEVSTPKIEIKNLAGNVGQSYFAVKGFLSNYLSYFLQEGVLKGEFTLSSDFFNLTELATIQNQITVQKADSAIIQHLAVEADSILAFEVPARMDLRFRSEIKKAVFDRMEIHNINGVVALHDKELELTNLDMEMLQGKLEVNGMYKGNEQLHPDFDFKLKAEDFDVQSAYRSLSMIRRYLPIAARSQGKISTSLSLKGRMNEKLELIGPSLDGNGLFNTRQLMVVDNPAFSQLKGIIKSEKLKNVKVDDFTARYSIEKGNLLVNPFQTKVADQDVRIQGKLSVRSELDFLLDFKLNRDDLGGDINKGLDFIPGSRNIKKVDVGVKITGPIKHPKVSVDLDTARKQIMEEVKKAGAQEIQDKVKKIGNELKKLFK